MTGSRGGFIGLVSLGLFIVLLSKNKGKAILTLSLIGAITAPFLANTLIARYQTILQLGGSGVSANSRIVGFYHGIAMLIRRPILGVGIGAYPIARKDWFNWSLWAHNHYGQLFGELGILGTATWGLMVYYTIRYARSLRLRIDSLSGDNSYKLLYYTSYAIEVSTYSRLVLGMTTHSLHIPFWYINAALIFCSHVIISDNNLNKETG